MRKLFLIKNPELFQGEKYLKTGKPYFEGWYFKNTNKSNGISFIPGININGHEKKAFIQVITTDASYFVDYHINDFAFSHNPFFIRVGNNFFSRDAVRIDIHDKSQNLIVYGDVKYSNPQNINTNFLNPNIMGPFSYLPFMECNHAILCMKNKANGFIKINNRKIDFDNSIGYIEKDWGCSFPKSYVWCQGNDFQSSRAAFMLSIADIPFGTFHFKGIICSLMVGDKEFRFATYNNAKLIKYDASANTLFILLKRGYYSLSLKANDTSGLKLFAPVKGQMEKNIFESITASITVTLKWKNKIIFSDTSRNCGMEQVSAKRLF